MPLTDNLPDRWYDTPNIHLCTIKDFLAMCEDVGARVERAVALNAYGRKLGVSMPGFAQNLFGEQAVFLLVALILPYRGVTPAGTGTMRRRALTSRTGTAA